MNAPQTGINRKGRNMSKMNTLLVDTQTIVDTLTPVLPDWKILPVALSTVSNEGEKNIPLSDTQQPYSHIIEQLTGEGKERLLICTSPDRVGEALAYQLAKALDIDIKLPMRICLSSLAEEDVLAAIQAPRPINLSWVAAHEAQKTMDNLMGFRLSPILWKYLKSTRHLPVGRLAALALNMLKREKGTSENARQVVKGTFIHHTGISIEAFSQDYGAKTLHNVNSQEYKLTEIKQTYTHLPPPPLFTTVSLWEEAAEKLSFPVIKTAQTAMALYEKGMITYPYSSVPLKEYPINTSFLLDTFGSTAMREEASPNGVGEGILPVDIVQKAGMALSREEALLYQLITSRTVASFMNPQQQKVTTLLFSNGEQYFQGINRQIVESGWQTAYGHFLPEWEKQEENKLDSSLVVGKSFQLTEVSREEKPYTYTEVALCQEFISRNLAAPRELKAMLQQLYQREYLEVKRKSVPVLEISSETTPNIGGHGLSIGKPGLQVTGFMEKRVPALLEEEYNVSLRDYLEALAAGEGRYQEIVYLFNEKLKQALLTPTFLRRIQRKKRALDFHVNPES